MVVPDSVSGLGLEARESEPGVVLLRPEGGGDAHGAADLMPDIVGLDGSLWRFRIEDDDEADRQEVVLTRYGQRGSVPWKRYWEPYEGDIEVGPDGTVWARLEKGVISYDGKSWTVHQKIAEEERWGGPYKGDEAVFEDEDGSAFTGR